MDKNALNIILCDDDEDDSEFFRFVTRQWAPEAMVKIAQSADELIKELKTSSDVDLVFLDLNMPVISGKECLKMIRADEAFAKIPIIIYSTAANDVDVEATFRTGANLYVQKPASAMALKNILDKIAAMDKAELMSHHQRKFLLEV